MLFSAIAAGIAGVAVAVKMGAGRFMSALSPKQRKAKKERAAAEAAAAEAEAAAPAAAAVNDPAVDRTSA